MSLFVLDIQISFIFNNKKKFNFKKYLNSNISKF